jgi:hypothetical protein
MIVRSLALMVLLLGLGRPLAGQEVDHGCPITSISEVFSWSIWCDEHTLDFSHGRSPENRAMLQRIRSAGDQCVPPIRDEIFRRLDSGDLEFGGGFALLACVIGGDLANSVLVEILVDVDRRCGNEPDESKAQKLGSLRTGILNLLQGFRSEPVKRIVMRRLLATRPGLRGPYYVYLELSYGGDRETIETLRALVDWEGSPLHGDALAQATLKAMERRAAPNEHQ